MSSHTESDKPPDKPSGLAVHFTVEDVDPTRVDPHDVAEWITDVLDVEVRAGNAEYRVTFESAEWADA